jgi:hypothetical protein
MAEKDSRTGGPEEAGYERQRWVWGLAERPFATLYLSEPLLERQEGFAQ